MASTWYGELLKDPRWMARREEILFRDRVCQGCFSVNATPLHVHHKWYESGLAPWDYPDEALVLLCSDCHGAERAWKKQALGDLTTGLRVAGFEDRHLVQIGRALQRGVKFYDPESACQRIVEIFTPGFKE